METIRDAGPNLKSFYYHVCKPENDNMVKGSVVVLHGAEGHGARYESFGEELVKRGYAMFAIDHIGHGLTAPTPDELGEWKNKDFYYSTYNAFYLVDIIKRKYPGKPVFVLGHDYGGTMAQYMMGKFEVVFDGIIISSCGMPSGRDKRTFLKAWFKKIFLYDGNKSKGTYKSRTRFLNFHYRPTRTKYDWLNSVPEEVDRFIEDPLAGYIGTIGYYYYQYKYIVLVPRIVDLKNVKKNFPILLLGGREDYITGRGRKIDNLRNYYTHKGLTNVNMKLYERSRHDVLLEWNKEEVVENIVAWMNENTGQGESNYLVTPKNVDTKIETFKEREIVQTKKEKLSFKEEEPDDDLRISTDIKK